MQIKPLDTGNLLTIIGWVVSFCLGLLSAVIVQKRGKTKKVLGWTLVSESDLLSREVQGELETGFGVPVKVVVNGIEERELTTVRVRIVNVGNIELQSLNLFFRFGPDAKVHVGRYIGELGIYRDKLKLLKQENTATLTIAHINERQAFEVEFLVARHRPEHFAVELAEPGVALRQVDASTFELPKDTLQSFALSVFGVRYDPSVAHTARLADEVKKLNATIERIGRRGER